MPPAGFKPGNPASELPQTLALNRSAAGSGKDFFVSSFYFFLLLPYIFLFLASPVYSFFLTV
jgi:hypothetical protein